MKMRLLDNIVKNFRLKKSLNSDGVRVETQFVLNLNNDNPRYFVSREDLKEFLSLYGKSNQIFSLHVFRIEVYSLIS